MPKKKNPMNKYVLEGSKGWPEMRYLNISLTKRTE